MKIHEIYNCKRQKDKDIGIEIEIEGTNLKYPINRYWNGKPDGSLRGNSMEYILKSPVHRSKTKSRLFSLKTELEDYNSILNPSDRCGVHIHVNCQDLTVKEVINFAIVYLILENLLVEMCGENRIGNLFCLRASDAETIISTLRRCKQENSLDFIQHNRYRYASINLAALSKFGSVEFRAFQTPKNIMKIQGWIDILLRIKDASLEFKDAHDIIESVSFGGPEVFVRNILGAYAKNITLEGREHLITEGVRRVQEIAYVREKKKKVSQIADSGQIIPQPLLYSGVVVESGPARRREGMMIPSWRPLGAVEPPREEE